LVRPPCVGHARSVDEGDLAFRVPRVGEHVFGAVLRLGRKVE
jgi:hypothetical protein